MATLMGTTAFGTDVAQVYDGLRKLGLRGRAVYIPSRDCDALHVPAVLFVDYGSEPLGHAVCLMGEKDGRAEIWNPQGGKSLQTQAQLAGTWRGHAMEVAR
jgi:ABC-type bacteriocin/lantibiotic exporter with double-glycine peptidase domain